LIEAGMLGQITEEQVQWLKAIQENTDRSFRVLDAVERLIAIQQDDVRIDWSNFIASELIDEAKARVQDQVQVHRHTLELQIPDNVPVARGDFYQSMIVLTELLDNAIRYTPQGGTIRLSVDNLGSHVLFSVADSGIGLRPEDLDKVGKPFWRGDYQPLVRQYTGTGLSLFLAQQLLALQGGELIFSGEADLGSTFSFTLGTAANAPQA
jgi:signal transduction histidine kinase